MSVAKLEIAAFYWSLSSKLLVGQKTKNTSLKLQNVQLNQQVNDTLYLDDPLIEKLEIKNWKIDLYVQVSLLWLSAKHRTLPHATPHFGHLFLVSIGKPFAVFNQQICTACIISFGLLHESLGGFFWVLGLVLDSRLAFDTSSRLSGAYPTLTKKGLVFDFASFISFGIHIPEYIHCKQQR